MLYTLQEAMKTSGAGKIGRRSLSRTEKEGAWTRVALKKGHILEGYRNAGGFFGRGPKAGGFESILREGHMLQFSHNFRM